MRTTVGGQKCQHLVHTGHSSQVYEWMKFVSDSGIRRVCCLLPPEQLSYYDCNLLEEYRVRFGEANVCSAPVEDYHLCEARLLEAVVLPFLAESDRRALPIVVHCSGGSGRTGHVLAAWLVRQRGLSVEEALAAVAATGRNPLEAIQSGNATEEELRQLLRGE